MIPFHEFVERHEGCSRTDFKSAIRDPHLVLWTELDDEDSSERMPSQFLTGRHPTQQGVVAPMECPIGVLPVVKREGSNAFTLMVTIGRASNNDIVLADRRVSKFHAYLRRVGGDWTISDANSTNGTRVDEVPVPAERGVNLRSGARILLGGAVSLEFLEAEDLFERTLGGQT